MYKFIPALFALAFVACASDNSKVDLKTLPTAAIVSDSENMKRDSAYIVSDSQAQANLLALTDSLKSDSTKPKRQEKPNLSPPQISFADTTWKFGTIRPDTAVEHRFDFVNTGDKPLEIKKVEGSCGCTVGGYPFLLIKKGEAGFISAKFDSKNKKGKQRNTLTVYSNAENSPHILVIQGSVN
jgi:hypothetical protein